jgi:peptide deformylase
MGYTIRTFGDPVLKSRAAAVTEIDGKVARLVDDMFDTLYSSDNGIGLAAPQIGVQKQIFVWDMEDEPLVIINPEIVEASGELVYDEGCLSIPGLYAEILRPEKVLLRGLTSTATPSRWRPTAWKAACSSTNSTICTGC